MMITKETTSARTPIAIRVICHPIRLRCCVQVLGTSRKKRNVTEVEIRKMTTWTFIKHIIYIRRQQIPKSSYANKFGWCKVKVNTIECMHAVVIKCIETIGMACQTARCLPTKPYPYQLLTLFLGFWMIQCISVVIYMYLHLAALLCNVAIRILIADIILHSSVFSSLDFIVNGISFAVILFTPASWVGE